MIHEYEFVLILDRNIVASIHCMWLCVSGRKKIAAKMLGSVQSFSNFRDDCGHDVRGGHAKGNVELRSEMRVKTGLREVSELRTGMSAMRGEWERTVQEKLQTLDQVPKKSRRAEERTVLEPGPAMCEAFAERFAALESRMSARLEASEQAAKEKEEQRGFRNATLLAKGNSWSLQESQAAAVQAETLQQAQDAQSVASHCRPGPGPEHARTQ